MRYVRAMFVAMGWVALVAAPSFGADIKGAGSTFVFPVLSRWAQDYRAANGVTVTYQPVGSGAGLAMIKSGAVDFAASDAPLKSGEIEKLGLVQFPLVMGGIVPVVNIDGIKPGELKFTGPLLADIFLGKISRWNDPAIRAHNANVNLPEAPISVVHRSDGSGTTFNWSNYLMKVSPEWREKVGDGTVVTWPVGLGGKGNDGVATTVMRTKNAIGYVEYAYAQKNNMAFGLVRNSTGAFVKPAPETFAAAALGADWTAAGHFYLILTNAPGAEAFPITATSFVIMQKKPRDLSGMKSALAFFRSVLTYGRPQAHELSYVPLPEPLVGKIEEYWKAQFASVTD